TLSLGNRYRGVLIVSGSSNIIGGTTPELRNLISGNGDSGIDIRSQQYNQFASNNVIQGNYIGTDATGTAAVGNQFAGVNLTSWTSGTLLGGPEVGARNLISGNPYYGIVMFNANGSKIQNNYIGTNASGTGPLGNGITAIHMSDSYTNTIGGAVGLGNLIAYNGNGIEIDSGEGNVINTNSIHSNTRYGIDLRIPTEVEGGPTPNDALDPDGGPNRLQNFPVLSANSTQSQIKGSMNSLPNTMFTIEFFANDTCDSTGYGEGKTFLGTTSATTAGNGNASFTFEPDAPVPGGTYITSTATDPSGNTSEFSACLLIQGPPTATPTNTAIPSATSTNTVVPSATSTVTGGNPSATVTRTATSTSSNPSPTATSQVPGDCQVSFTDVPEGSTFYQYVQCLACKGILGGYSDGTFRTNNDVTRGQLSKIVSNAAGFNEAVSGQTFSDVAPDSPFYAYVERMVSRGIISGYGDGTFRPNANATRGQISKIVANARSYTEPVSGQTFSDVAPDSPFYAYIERMVSRGIISGYGDGTFRPNANATRGQTAKIVSNAFFPNCQPAN
ncbi:MAG TPA: S-layer homology domain-containing protein, partial [Chloroflexia bacterium]